MMKKFILALISMSLLLASGCAHIEEYDTEETADTEETTEVQTVTVDNPKYYTRFKNDGISINVYNWGEYIPDGSEEGVLNLNAEFTKLTGITVNYSTYATNEELYAKLKGGGSTYDIIIPSDYMISRMIKENMLEPLDKSNIPNFANKIHKESGRLLSLISDIMELSQLDEKFSDEEFAPVDLAGVAAEVAEDLRSNAEKHGITIAVDTKTAVINGNRNQIYELIYNLCDNAIRYNRENGSVKIITGDDNEHPFVKVADTGIGLPEKHHKRVFERFYRVDQRRSKETGGTGLGLAIVKHITERHGGEISLESSEQGTTFTARF